MQSNLATCIINYKNVHILWPSNPTSGKASKKHNLKAGKALCIKMLITALFITTKTWEQNRGLTTWDWLSKSTIQWNIYSMEHPAAIKTPSTKMAMTMRKNAHVKWKGGLQSYMHTMIYNCVKILWKAQMLLNWKVKGDLTRPRGGLGKEEGEIHRWSQVCGMSGWVDESPMYWESWWQRSRLGWGENQSLVPDMLGQRCLVSKRMNPKLKKEA